MTKILNYLFISLSIHVSIFYDRLLSVQNKVLKVLCKDKERTWLKNSDIIVDIELDSWTGDMAWGKGMEPLPTWGPRKEYENKYSHFFPFSFWSFASIDFTQVGEGKRAELKQTKEVRFLIHIMEWRKVERWYEISSTFPN